MALSEAEEKDLRKWAISMRARGDVRARQVVELFMEVQKLRQENARLKEDMHQIDDSNLITPPGLAGPSGVPQC